MRTLQRTAAPADLGQHLVVIMAVRESISAHREERRSWVDRWPPEILVTLAMAVAGILAAPLNTDAGWYLVGARRLLAGERLYVDLFEVNPPLFFWLLAPPAWAGQRLALSDTTTIGLVVAMLVVVSTLVAMKTVSLFPVPPRALRSGLICGFLVAFVLLSAQQVGQRDGVAAILLLPYALLAAHTADAGETSFPLSVVCGVLGGLGVALKPFFLAPWLAIELVVLVSRRQPRTLVRVEAVLVLLIQCAYAGLVLVLTPEFFSRMVPLARSTYGAYGPGPLAVLRTETVRIFGLYGLTALLASAITTMRRRQRLPEILGAATLGFLADYVLQGKGWFYHSIPVLVFAAAAMIAAGEHLIEALRAFPRQTFARRVRVMMFMALFMVAAVWSFPVATWRTREGLENFRQGHSLAVVAMAELVSTVAIGEPIYVLSTNVFPAFPVVNLGRAIWPYHYNCLWPLPALYAGEGVAAPAYRRASEQGAVERVFFDTVVDDVVKTPPRLLIVDRARFKQAMGRQQFDFLEYFSGSPAFRTLLRRYRNLGYIGQWEIYERDG